MKKKIIIGILIIIEIGLIMINYNTSLSNKEIDKIETKEETKEIKGNNTLAIMVKSKNDTEYTPSDTNTWPTGEYKYAGSLCIGNDGREIEEDEVISFDNDNHTATITTKDTIYCYLYFAEGEDAVTRIKRLSGDSLENEQDVGARGDVLRRFQGTAEKVNNNYICFGTSITEECVKNTDRYMYRIIGYATADDDNTNTKKGQLKLIKKEALEEAMPWHYNHNDNINWFQSDLYNRITTKEYLTNKYYVPSGWENKIADHTWWTGDIQSYAQDGVTVYKIETGKESSEYNVLNMESGSKTVHVVGGGEGDPYYNKDIKYDRIQEKWNIHQNAKVGLMNASDYYLTYGGAEKTCASNTDCVNSWAHLSKNDTANLSTTKLSPPWPHEHMMSRFGFAVSYGSYMSLYVHSNGGVSQSWGSDGAVRPVIYTTENITLNGSGTITDPFIITN